MNFNKTVASANHQKYVLTLLLFHIRIFKNFSRHVYVIKSTCTEIPSNINQHVMHMSVTTEAKMETIN